MDFAATKEVCALFDTTVLTDLAALTADENDTRTKPVFALGWNSEPAAGIRYGTMTGWFDSEEELEKFCQRNLERFRIYFVQDESETVPDATDWA